MQRFKKILFVNEPNNSDISALSRAVELARKNGAQLTLCDASKMLPRTLVNLQQTFMDIHNRQLLSQLNTLDYSGVETSTRSLVGVPFVEIIREVLTEGHDLVIKSAEGSSSVLSNLFGETDMNLMRKCPCPVWINKPSGQKQISKIIAAIDPDPSISENKNLNKLILDLATSLARQENCELLLVHAWELEGETVLRGNQSGMTNLEVDSLEEESKSIHEGWLNDTLKTREPKAVKLKVQLVKGQAGNVIPAMVKDQAADLVVMGSVARTGIEGFYIGNTAEKILRNVDCSVLTIKPESFKTPVRI